jgi:hypothetical protein
VSINGTGTSEVLVEVVGPDLIQFNVTRLVEGRDAGKYFEPISFTAEPDAGCDPTTRKRLHCISYFLLGPFRVVEPCEQWLPGSYNVTVHLCNGKCGSKFPHSAVYDTAQISFELIS